MADKVDVEQAGAGFGAKSYSLAIVQAGLNFVPFAGGALSSALSSYTSEAMQRRMINFMAAVEQRLADMGRALTQLEDRQQEQILRLLLEARATLDHEKLGRLRNAAVHAITDDVEEAWFAQLRDCVASIGTDEVVVLKEIYRLFSEETPKQEYSNHRQHSIARGWDSTCRCRSRCILSGKKRSHSCRRCLAGMTSRLGSNRVHNDWYPPDIEIQCQFHRN